MTCENKTIIFLDANNLFRFQHADQSKGPCNKSRGQVPSCEQAIFASKSSRRKQLHFLQVVPQIQTSLNFWDKSLRLVPQDASCKRFVGQVPVSSCNLFRGLVAGTSPLVCADLNCRFYFKSPSRLKLKLNHLHRIQVNLSTMSATHYLQQNRQRSQ